MGVISHERRHKMGIAAVPLVGALLYNNKQIPFLLMLIMRFYLAMKLIHYLFRPHLQEHDVKINTHHQNTY